MGANQFTLQTQKRIDQFTKKALKGLPLTALTYDITTRDGRLGMLTSSPVISHLYQKADLPVNFVDSAGNRLMSEGYHTLRMLRENYAAHAPSVNQFCRAINASHTLHFCSKASAYDTLFSFSFNCSDAVFEQILLNGKDQLNHAIASFTSQHQPLIAKAIELQHSTELRVQPEYSTHQPSMPIFIDVRRQSILAVTPQQSRCLFLLLSEGIMAKLIAKKLELSHRTVQHYLDAVRYNNGFASLKELMLFVRVA